MARMFRNMARGVSALFPEVIDLAEVYPEVYPFEMMAELPVPFGIQYFQPVENIQPFFLVAPKGTGSSRKRVYQRKLR